MRDLLVKICVQAPLCLMTTERSGGETGLRTEFKSISLICASQRMDHSPMDCIMPFRAVFIGSFSGSLAEGSPSQSQR